MATNQLYHTWLKKIMQLLPDERITRIRNLAWLLTGIYLSRSVHLSRVASKLPGGAVLTSTTRRLDRFLENTAVRVRDWYAPVVQQLLAQRAGQRLRLIVDGSRVGFGHQLLIVTLAYRKRAIPLVWMWVRGTRGHSSAGRQLALLHYIYQQLPPGTPVLLLGDQEFGSVEVLRQLDAWHWEYVLRQKGSLVTRQNKSTPWRSFNAFVQKAGDSVWLGWRQLTREQAYPVNLLAHWKLGEPEPWYLATNLPSLQAALAAYEKRMWIEEMFGDLKDNGFDLESTHLRATMKLHRLSFAVILLYLDLLTSGSKAVKASQRNLVDRADRRDLSLFRIGLYLRDRHLANVQRFSVNFLPVV